MPEKTPNSKIDQSAKQKAARSSLRTIAIGYGVVALFLGTFFMTMVLGARLNQGIGQPRWALLLSVVAILPLFLPVLLTHVIPRISTLKISNLMEMSFARDEATGYSVADSTVKLPAIAGEASAVDYATMMTSFSSVIVDMIRTVRTSGEEVVVVDLGDGAKWIPPNLFILARLARDYTSVRLIGFIETRKAPGAFVGMCSPKELVDGLGVRFPALMQANSQTPDIDQPPGNVASSFFSALVAIYQQSPEVMKVKEMWLNGPLLSRLLAAGLCTDQVEWLDPLPASSSKYILERPNPYVAAVWEEQLQFFIERDRFALLVAKQMMQGR